MSLPNPSMSFTPFDILTAEEMNNLVENDQALAAGTGFNTGAIPTAAYANTSVTAAKIDFASFVGRQNNTTNTTIGGIHIETGWGYILGNSTAMMNETVTFGNAFTSAPVVLMSFAGYNSVAPTTNANAADNNAYIVSGQSITTTTFAATMYRQGGTFANTLYYVYNWVAIGN